MNRNPKEETKKLLDLINEFNRVAGHKMNTQKLVVFLYTSTKQSEKGIKKTIPFIIVSKWIKYLEKI